MLEGAMTMNLTELIAKHIRDVHFGGNWTTSNMSDVLADIEWTAAVKKVDSFNTIAMLVFHINYYVDAIIKVLEGKSLDANDKYSYDLPPIQSQEDWLNLVNKSLRQAEEISALIEKLPDSILQQDFVDKQYGNYFRNFHGLIEHTHYHLGQIVILKKMIMNNEKSDVPR